MILEIFISQNNNFKTINILNNTSYLILLPTYAQNALGWILILFI